jgi:hypothetical protein
MICMCTARWSALGLLGLLLIGAGLIEAKHLRGADQCHITTPPATLPSEGFAVVELFTSEGCSSCPPADKLLSQMVTNARKNGSRIYPLAFHVDYWNHLGWTDRFSTAEFSRRQQDYSDALGTRQIYTPQMIVNGSVEFVGSDADRAAREISKALARPAAATVKITARTDKDHLHIEYSTTKADDMKLSFAVVERGLTSDVKRGENSGRQLQHDNVVRAFKQIAADASGKMDLDLPKSFSLENATVIAFISDTSTGAIRGATSTDLSRSPSMQNEDEHRDGARK